MGRLRPHMSSQIETAGLGLLALALLAPQAITAWLLVKSVGKLARHAASS